MFQSASSSDDLVPPVPVSANPCEPSVGGAKLSRVAGRMSEHVDKTRRLSVGAPLFNQCPMPWAGRAGTRATISMHLRRDGSWPTARHRLFHRNRSAHRLRPPAVLAGTRSTRYSPEKPRGPLKPFFFFLQRRARAYRPTAAFLEAARICRRAPGWRTAQRVGGAGAKSLERDGWTRSLCGASATPLAPEHAGCDSLLNQVQERSRTLHRRRAHHIVLSSNFFFR